MTLRPGGDLRVDGFRFGNGFHLGFSPPPAGHRFFAVIGARLGHRRFHRRFGLRTAVALIKAIAVEEQRLRLRLGGFGPGRVLAAGAPAAAAPATAPTLLGRLLGHRWFVRQFRRRRRIGLGIGRRRDRFVALRTPPPRLALPAPYLFFFRLDGGRRRPVRLGLGRLRLHPLQTKFRRYQLVVAG